MWEVIMNLAGISSIARGLTLQLMVSKKTPNYLIQTNKKSKDRKRLVSLHKNRGILIETIALKRNSIISH